MSLWLGVNNRSISGSGGGGGGGAGTPAQVQNVKLWNPGTPGVLYATFPMPTAGSAAITQFTGTLSGGVTGTQNRFTHANTSNVLDALSCRVDFFGVANSAQTCTIQAVNSFGASTASTASNTVTPVAFTDTWVDGASMHVVACGGTQIGLSSLWHDGYFDFQNTRYVVPGDPTITTSGLVPTMNAPAYPTGIGMTSQKMAELTPSGSGSGYGYLVNIFMDNAVSGQNGTFNSNPYSRFCFYVYPAQAGTITSQNTETTYNVEGQISAVSGNVTTFLNQTMGTNTFPSGSSAIYDRNRGTISGISANDATTVTNLGSLLAQVGDYLVMQIGDQAVQGNSNDIAPFIISPNSGSLTVGSWNRVEIPLGAAAWNLRSANQGMHYKWAVSMPAPSPTSVTYFCNVGWVA